MSRKHSLSWQRADGWLPGDGAGRSEKESYDRHEETFGSTVCIRDQIVSFKYMQVIINQLFLSEL